MRRRTFVFGAVALMAAAPCLAIGLNDLSRTEATTGLKDALTQGSRAAVAQLSAPGGFLDNEKVRIPLPDSLARIEGGLRLMGMGQQADDLRTAMNRAAEMAVKEATPLLIDSVKQMSVSDAREILNGPGDAATQYFRRTTANALTERFLPIVQQATAKVQLAEQYNRFAGRAAQLGLVDLQDANLDRYVTGKALDGLFTVIAEQERAIRAHPAAAATSIAQKVFGALQY
jgi:hypothetical protein